MESQLITSDMRSDWLSPNPLHIVDPLCVTKNKKMKLIQSIIIIIIFSSCSSIGKKDILYGKCEKRYFACNQFELKKDKTFEYYIFMDVGGGNVIKGEWEYINGDTLKLNTFEQPNISKTYYKGVKNPELENRIKIKIQDFETPLIGVHLVINNGKENGQTDYDGICYFRTNEINNISIYYVGYKEETIEIVDSTMNDIEIYLSDNDSEIVPKYFVDKKIVANKKQIIMRPNTPERKYSLKRSRFGKKHWK